MKDKEKNVVENNVLNQQQELQRRLVRLKKSEALFKFEGILTKMVP